MLYEDRNGVIWIGTSLGLDYLLVEEQGELKPKFIHHQNDVNDPKSLAQNVLFSFFQDSWGNYWMGTWSRGVDYLNAHNKRFDHFRYNKDELLSLGDDNVTCFAENNLGIWIGTDGGGLSLFDRKENKFVQHISKEDKAGIIRSNKIRSVFADEDSSIWIGTFEGLVQYHPKTGRSELVFGDHIINYIIKGIGNELWFGGTNSLIKFNKKDRTYIEYFNNIDDTTAIAGNTNILYADKNKDIWIGTNNGLHLYNRKQDNFIRYQYSPINNTSLSNDNVVTITNDNNGALWIGTYDGLNKYNPVTQSFIRYSENNGLPDNVVNGIITDKHNKLWLSTNKGLVAFYLKNESGKEVPVVRLYTKVDGLQGEEFIRHSYLRTKNGEFLFGGTNGFNIFHPDSIRDNLHIPDIVFTELRLFNKPVRVNDETNLLSEHITLTKRITLSYKQSVVSFSFAALSYASPEKNQFAYMMEGFETEWNYSGNKHEATYTNLPAGDYVFRVKASNNDGIWNTEGASLNIKVIPPYWKTWWFRITIAVLLALIIYIYYSRRLLEVKKINRKLEMKVQERTRELFEKNTLLIEQSESLNETNTQLEERQQIIEEQSEELRAQRDELSDSNEVKDKLFSVIAHDLKNPFGTVLGFSELLYSKYHKFDETKRMRMVTNIFQASQVIYDLITSLLDWSRSQMGNINPVFNLCNINEIITSNIKLASIQSNDKEVEIISDGILEDVVIEIDKDLISTVIRNLISNAIKFTQKGGTVSVSCEKQTDIVIIRVRDTGVGISKEIIPTIFQRAKRHITQGTDNEKGTGLGLLICQDFVRLHKGEIWVESEKGKGSEFSFSLPLEQGS